MSLPRWLALYALAWTPVAVMFSVALLVTDRVPAAFAAYAGILSTMPAALLGLPVISLTRRMPWGEARVWRMLLVHGAVAIAYSAAWLVAIVLEIWLTSPADQVQGFLRFGAAWQGAVGGFMYAVIVGMSYALATARKQREQERLAARAEALRLRAELEALRARLEPHFLFNVLHTIGALIAERPANAHEALELLASLLKRRLDAARTGDDATFVEEMVDVREYCALERLRLGTRLTVAESLDPATAELLVPRFTLQPLVENAIRHGIAPVSRPGTLTVSAARNGSSWTLTVQDDGGGAPLAAVDGAAGVGLSIVRERLRLRFGERASLTVRTSPGSGCMTSLSLPVETDADDTLSSSSP